MSYSPVSSEGKLVSFNSIPQTVDNSYVSLSAATQNTSGLGNLVVSSQHAGYVDSVETVLVTWARASSYPAWAALDPTGYSHPITAGIFKPIHGAGGAVTFEFIGESTTWIHVPWRPNTLPDGKPYPYNGYAFKVTIPFLTGVLPPDEYAVLISYNTQKTGYTPIGVAGPYNELNFALKSGAPAVGTDPDLDAVLWVKPDHWYYPATNWSSYGSPMTKVVLRGTATPPGATSTPPVNAGSYQVVAKNGATVTANAYLTISPAQAQIALANLVKTKDGEYAGPEVITVPPGLATSVTYSGSTVVPNTVGTFPVQAVVNDPNYLGSKSDVLTVTGALYQDWMKKKYPLFTSDGAEFSKEADFDGDGLSNFIEYGLGTDPTAPNGNPLVAALTPGGAIVLHRQKGSPEAGVIVERSFDLVEWNEVTGTVSDEGNDMERVEYSPEGWHEVEQGYLRIRVEPTIEP